VTGVVNLTGLMKPEERVAGMDAVLNGIAYDAQHDRLFVTGKNWPKMFEIRVLPAGQLSGATH
jgi:glutaminyl-peptide cyclotransferase